MALWPPVAPDRARAWTLDCYDLRCHPTQTCRGFIEFELKHSPKVSRATVTGCLAPFAVIPLALFVAVRTEGLPRLIAIGVLAVFAAWFALMGLNRDPLDAWRNDRLNELAPWLHRNEDIGKTALAIENFDEGSGRSIGRVNVGGEIWQAICMDGSTIGKGNEVFVVARDGLILIVSKSEESVPRGMPW